MKKYYTGKEITEGVEDLPPISLTTLRNLRLSRKLKYTKLGKECIYTKEWIEDYLNSNIVEVKSA